MMKPIRCTRIRLLLLCILTVSWVSGCSKEGKAPQSESPGSVLFKIESAPVTGTSDADTQCWRATYDIGGKTACFRIEVSLKKPAGDSPFAFTKGVFYREKGSEPEVFLRRIADALEARAPVKPSQRVEMLPFTAAILGTDLSRGTGDDVLAGSFTSKPKGNWIALKVFLADGEAEFFLNLNPTTRTGEISIKDAEYGNIAVTELAKVL